LNFSNRIYLLPNGILILALLTVLYPTLVELHVEGKMQEFKETLRQGVGLVILLVFPMMVGLVVLRMPVVRLLFERGAFNEAATASTAFALAFYSLGLVALGIQLLINRAFYALKDTLTPMYVMLVMVGLNIFFNWLLIKPMAHGGIALGTALSINIGTVALAYLLWKKIGAFGGKQLMATFWKCGVSALFMGLLLVFGVKYLDAAGFLRQAVELGILIGLGALVYFLLIYWLRVEELRSVLGFVRRRLVR
jgi:putative peptidoglycan lipid II flippase